MGRLPACFLAGMMICGSAFAGMESDKASSGLKFKEAGGKSGFSMSRANSGSGGVYIGGASSSRSKSARRSNYGKNIVRSGAGKSLAAKVPEIQQASAGQPAAASGGKSSMLSSVGKFASKAVKAATSPTGKKVALGLLGAAAVAGGLALVGGVAGGVGVGAAVKAGAVISAKAAWGAVVAVNSSLAFNTFTSYFNGTKEAH